MHQPLYKDELTGRYYLPWVRLHALKGYYDMPALLEKFPKIKQTFNLTPSLLYQVRDYLQNQKIQDDFLQLTLKPARDLSPEDKEFLLTHFFMNNWTNIVKPHLRYSQLLNKRGVFASSEEIQKRIPKFDEQEFLDLQVLFNLMWFGYAFRQKEPRLQALFQKGKNYSEEEKKEVIDFQFQVMRDMIPLYRRVADRGQIELTTTPFYHPILPLICDKTLNYAYSWEEDARWQVQEGIRYFEDCFGRRPFGMWPAEGSVSPDILPLFTEQKIQWIASDEEILLCSSTHQNGSETLISSLGKREDLIYFPYSVSGDNAPIAMIYRDKKLSDLIGFSYTGANPKDACEDFMKKLYAIQEQVSSSSDSSLVSIILDGENAWEHYRDGGEEFLSMLYGRLSEESDFETVTVSDYLNRFPPVRTVTRLHAGSWINHDFSIWYGHAEDRLAWDYLAKTRRLLTSEQIPPEIQEKAWREIYAAEGSDWYWWFGDDFSSATEDVFDFLFRNHLMNVYRLLDRRFPAYLKKPIKQVRKSRVKREPIGFIFPDLDGKVTTFYEWENAGLYQVSEPREVMQQAERFVSEIYYGFNLEFFFLRIDFSSDISWAEWKNTSGIIHIHDAGKRTGGSIGRDFDINFQFYDKSPIEVYSFDGSQKKRMVDLGESIRLDRIVELRIPFQRLNLEKGDQVEFTLSIMSASGISLEEWPRHGVLSFEVPDESFESLMWSI